MSAMQSWRVLAWLLCARESEASSIQALDSSYIRMGLCHGAGEPPDVASFRANAIATLLRPRAKAQGKQK